MIEKRETVTGLNFSADGTIHELIHIDFIEDGVVTGTGQGPTINTYFPGDDVGKADERVQAIAKVVWTDEIVKAYQASKPPAPNANQV